MCLFKPGDIVKWKPIDREEYDATVAAVDGPVRADDPRRDLRASPSSTRTWTAPTPS
jgi:hypothetical protein